MRLAAGAPAGMGWNDLITPLEDVESAVRETFERHVLREDIAIGARPWPTLNEPQSQQREEQTDDPYAEILSTVSGEDPAGNVASDSERI